LAVSLRNQKSRLLAGSVECFGQECQKHPSTNKATRCLANKKSGLPNTARPRRQPVIRSRFIKSIRRSSVVLFPDDLTAAIFFDRAGSVWAIFTPLFYEADWKVQLSAARTLADLLFDLDSG